MQFTLRIEGAELVRKGLEDLGREIPRISRETIWNTMNQIKTDVQTYPPKPRGSKYIRMFTLQAGWSIDKVSDLSYRIANAVPYTKYVVGDAYGTGQASVHAGRWILLRDRIDKRVSKLPTEVQDSIIMVARREGFQTA